MHSYIVIKNIKSARNLSALTHDEKLKEKNHEGVHNFQKLLKHWKTLHSIKNPEICWKCAYRIIDDSDHCNKVSKTTINEKGLTFDDGPPMIDDSWIKAHINMRTKKYSTLQKNVGTKFW